MLIPDSECAKHRWIMAVEFLFANLSSQDFPTPLNIEAFGDQQGLSLSP